MTVLLDPTKNEPLIVPRQYQRESNVNITQLDSDDEEEESEEESEEEVEKGDVAYLFKVLQGLHDSVAH